MNALTQVLFRERESLAHRDRAKRLKADFEKVAIPQLSRLYAAAFYFTKDKTEAEDLIARKSL